MSRTSQTKKQTTAQARTSKDKVTAANLALDVKNPIPFEPTGTSGAFHFAGRESKKYIPFLAPKDNFFQLLLEAKLLSPTNNSCVNSKADFCIGEGLVFNSGTEDQFFIDWAKTVNKKGQSLDTICKTSFTNFFTVGNDFVELVRVKVGSTRMLRVFPRSFLDCRLAEPDDDDIPRTCFVSKNFRQKNAWSLVDDQVVELPIYYGDDNMPWYVSEAGTEHCIIHLKNETPGYDYYGMPSNVASLPHQIMEYKTVRYNMDDIDNNMVVGGVVFIDANMTEEEARKVGKEIIHTHTGEGKRGRWTVLANPRGIKDAKIESFDTKKEGSFLKMDDSNEGKIIDSNNWDSALYGQHKTSGMGNGGFAYLSAVFDTKNKTVIQPMQTWLMENLVRKILHIHDYWVGTKWEDMDIGFKTVSPVSFTSEIDVNKILTKNEGRKLLGQPEDENADRGKEIIDPGNKPKDKNVQVQSA